MQQFVMPKEQFSHFVSEVMKSNDVVAPTRGPESKAVRRSTFAKISSPEDIFLEKITAYFPVKYFFFDKEEVLLQFDGEKITSPVMHITPTVFFGLRRCDLNAIKRQDIVFLENNPDPFYQARREEVTFIGYHCKEGDEYCFCNSVKLEEFYDLMFYDKGNHFAIEVGSEKGRHFVRQYATYFGEETSTITSADRKIINHKKLNTLQIDHLYLNQAWKQQSDECLSCAACNHLCPTCHCFEIKDEVDFTLTKGKRVRTPAACMLKSFTRVAGDHSFRDSRVSRFKHRIYHQIQYYQDRHGLPFCTGCGRCIRGCPVKIDWVETINKISV